MKKLASLLAFFLALSSATSGAREVSKCLAYAQTYYEQLYCEVSSAGRSHKLPSFIDFQKNPEITQALLLKPHAKALKIAIALPQHTSQKGTEKNRIRQNRSASLASKITPTPKDRFDTCSYQSDVIVCGQKRYKQVTNRHNRTLEQGALKKTNGLKLPVITLSPEEDGFEYALTKSYLLYLDKMMGIGLGGVTMTYTKFYYLYLDLLERNVDFNQRFSTMFEFLKKDKRALGVNNKPAVLASLSDKDCSRARASLFICQQGGRNYLFN